MIVSIVNFMHASLHYAVSSGWSSQWLVCSSNSVMVTGTDWSMIICISH